MLAVMLAAAIAAGPVESSRADRLAQYITATSPEAGRYAGELAERILYEAEVHGLDPALFAAIGYLESRYLLYPHGGGPQTHLAAPWQVYPSEAWLAIPRAQRLSLSRDLVISTWRAAAILSMLVRHCRRQGAACYCRYNRTPCRRGYTVALWQRARDLRVVLVD